MADRRMIHKKVVESDAFYALSEGAQSIYTHLTINADEDGFVNNAQSISARFKSGKKKLAELVEKRFVLKFDDVYVVKHWRVGNSLKNDRTKPPTYPSIAAAIWIKPNRAYTDHPVDGCKTLLETKTGMKLDSNWNPSGIQMDSQQNRTEEKGTEQNRTEESGGTESDFERLWSEYPEERRRTKQAALEAFKTEIASRENVDKAIKNLSLWKRSEQWCNDGGQYIPYMDNWILKGVWQTEPKKLIPHTGPRELDEDEVAAIHRMLQEW